LKVTFVKILVLIVYIHFNQGIDLVQRMRNLPIIRSLIRIAIFIYFLNKLTKLPFKFNLIFINSAFVFMEIIL